MLPALLRGEVAVGAVGGDEGGTVRALVTYGDQCCTVDAFPQMTGLQLKSLIMTTMQLEGGFGDYFLTCQGKTFPSKRPVNTVTEFVDGAALDLVRRGEGEKKHVGET